MVGTILKVIAVEPFTAKSEDGDYRVHTFERFDVFSGFQVLKFRNEFGKVLICPEEYLGTKLIEPKDLDVRSFPKITPYTTIMDDFIKEEDMTL